MPALTAIVKCIHHIVARADDLAPLFDILVGRLGLPVAWATQSYGWYASAGACLGNAFLEVARLGRAPARAIGTARLFGVAIEPHPLDASLQELAARGIPHSLPIPFYGERPDGTRGVRWTNVLLGGLAGEAQEALLRSRWWKEGTIARSVLGPPVRMLTIGHWARLASSGTGRYMVFMCEYAREMVAELAVGVDAFRRSGGGPLQLDGVAEVVIGASHHERARQRWQNLLAPLLPVERGYWQPGEGPGIRIVAHDEDAMLALILRTRDLASAEAWLRERRMLGSVAVGQITIDPAAIYGLDIRLVP